MAVSTVVVELIRDKQGDKGPLPIFNIGDIYHKIMGKLIYNHPTTEDEYNSYLKPVIQDILRENNIK